VFNTREEIMSRGIVNRNRWPRRAAVGTVFGAVLSCSFAVTDATADKDDAAHRVKTDTPIKHLIVLIGENHSFDNIFATYRPEQGQSIANLLSKGIILQSGQPGPNFIQSQQYQINTPFPATYFIDATVTAGKTVYQQSPLTPTFPVPNTTYIPTAPGPLSQGQGPFDSTDVPDSLLPTIEPSLEKSDLGLLRTGATGLPMDVNDTRVTNATTLPNGVFEITGATLPYDSYTGDMVHRLFHMWQQSDCDVMMSATPSNPSGCLNDLYPFVGVARGDFSGANSMGFFNMLKGDAPVLKKIADAYTINDNYHQPDMGGTAIQHIMIGTADAIPWDTFQGVTQPPTASVADPDPKSSTNVAFQRDQAWTNCSDLTQPGIPAIVNYLATLPWKPSPNCESGRFYMINNLSPGFLPNGTIDAANILTGSKVPPSSLRTIGDELNEKKISWAYYGGGYNAAVSVANGSTDPVKQLIAKNYCDICNPFSYASSIMGDSTQRTAHIKDAIDFFSELDSGHLPSIAYVKPDSLVDGQTASSKLDLFEAMLENILGKLKAHPDLFEETAFIVTFDEGGGYWDSGFIQPLDFFGDGPRIPLVVISPFSRGGKVVHSYNDHASVVKFIERNWDLKPLTHRSRDNLPNPKMDNANPYVPVNKPAVGDLFDMFDFDHKE
jgi:phospholipase C